MNTTTETLHDCPKCGRKNFTKAGLKAHACKGAIVAAKPEPLVRFAGAVPLHNAYHRAAMLSAAQAACWLVLAGAELLRLKKVVGHGNWLGWVENNCEFGEHTARKYMTLAEKVKDKALKEAMKEGDANRDPDRVLALLEKPAHALGDNEQHALLKAVHNLTDGATVSELYEDFGIVKKLKSRGGARVKDPENGYDPNAPVENARDLLLHPLRAIAMRWTEKEAKLPLWSHLPPEELREIDGILLDLRTDLKAALKTK